MAGASWQHHRLALKGRQGCPPAPFFGHCFCVRSPEHRRPTPAGPDFCKPPAAATHTHSLQGACGLRGRARVLPTAAGMMPPPAVDPRPPAVDPRPLQHDTAPWRGLELPARRPPEPRVLEPARTRPVELPGAARQVSAPAREVASAPVCGRCSRTRCHRPRRLNCKLVCRKWCAVPVAFVNVLNIDAPACSIQKVLRKGGVQGLRLWLLHGDEFDQVDEAAHVQHSALQAAVIFVHDLQRLDVGACNMPHGFWRETMRLVPRLSQLRQLWLTLPMNRAADISALGQLSALHSLTVHTYSGTVRFMPSTAPPALQHLQVCGRDVGVFTQLTCAWGQLTRLTALHLDTSLTNDPAVGDSLRALRQLQRCEVRMSTLRLLGASFGSLHEVTVCHFGIDQDDAHSFAWRSLPQLRSLLFEMDEDPTLDPAQCVSHGALVQRQLPGCHVNARAWDE